MVSVSGIRGRVGEDITPELVSRYAAAFGMLAAESGNPLVVIGRDSRTSGEMLVRAATSGFQSVGVGVMDCGMVPTPTIAMAVEHYEAAGGLIITASHNPIEWNALKFLGPDGIFIDRDVGRRLAEILERDSFARAGWDSIGTVRTDHDAVARHLDAILALPYIDVERIRTRAFTVALDCVRGAGATAMPELLNRLGCTVAGMDLEPDGRFPRPPEPLPENLVRLSELVRESEADIGVAVDPDVDRMAIVDETGTPIGEDYTLAFAVDAVLAERKGPVVVNLSTSLVVDDAARNYGVEVGRVPVGEANVAAVMKERGAVIGGEGNGGVMLADLHLGRDAPLAAALVLHLLQREGSTVSDLVRRRPVYSIVKDKTPLGADVKEVYEKLRQRFPDAEEDVQDGLRLSWDYGWLHVRPSGTEPIIRMIAEAPDRERAVELVRAARDVL